MKNCREKLALFGGGPVRSRPFASNVIVDASEKREILDTLKSREFSRFMGSPTDDIRRVLRLKSEEACDYNPQYFTFLGGRKVREFERQFARHFKTNYAISVNSATSGLAAAIGAIGVEPGDQIITTSLSFNATATSILVFNAVPVFADVSKENFCIDPRQITKKITPRTKAILVVHLLGFPADMDAVMAIAREHNLKVIEDCAQAPGALYKGRFVGTIGDAGVFSFQETKNITTGEGGMIVTHNAEIAAKCRMIRNHGESLPDDTWPNCLLVNNIGFNFRMTEMTAALGIAQLKKLDRNNHIRNRNAEYLIKRLKNLPGLEFPEAIPGMVFHVLPMFYDAKRTGVSRTNVVHALRAEGLPVGTGYTRPLYENPIFLKRIAYGSKGYPFVGCGNGSEIIYRQGDAPVAEDLIRNRFIWFYHIHRPNTQKDMEDVARAFDKVFSQLDSLKHWDPAGAQLTYKW